MRTEPAINACFRRIDDDADTQHKDFTFLEHCPACPDYRNCPARARTAEVRARGTERLC